MRPFACSVCEQLLFFENSTCLRCGSGLGFVPEAHQLVTVQSGEAGLTRNDGEPGVYRRCANQLIARCNWLVPADDDAKLCASCRLTSVRPHDDEIGAMAAFADAETAKRRLLYQLLSLRLPVIDRSEDPQRGVSFEFLSSRGRTVITGHDAGVITLDLSESDDAHREFVRQQLGEPYRTVLGHLRHEIAHYYWPLVVVEAGRLDGFRELFGDERVSYEDALQAHYAQGPDFDWSATHVSEYATMHPWEDWAETFAHFLHIDSGLDTARTFGLGVFDPALTAGRSAVKLRYGVAIGPMVADWVALTLAFNAMSRSIGQGDLYPFVLSNQVIDKLDFVYRAVVDVAG